LVGSLHINSTALNIKGENERWQLKHSKKLE